MHINKIISRGFLLGAGLLRRLSAVFYKSQEELRTARWNKDQGDKKLRLEYDLNESSIVFDLGGYEGQWSSDVFSRYCCTIHVFEPVEDFASNIESRFRKNNKINVHRFGLGNKNITMPIAMNKDGSSLYQKCNVATNVTIVKAIDFMQNNNINAIDLMKINIEGAEYDLLEHLIEAGFVQNIKNIQIQFHDFIPDAERKMFAIQHSLQKTHRLTYQYPFVWENWESLS